MSLLIFFQKISLFTCALARTALPQSSETEVSCGCGRDRGETFGLLLRPAVSLLIFFQKISLFTCALARTPLPQSSETEVSCGCGRDRKGRLACSGAER